MKRARGMTLLEILVVLAILGLVTAILVVGLGRAAKLDLRSETGKLAAALRQGFDRAAATGAHHRVVLDLDQETFTLERCEGKIRLHRTKDEATADQQAKVAAEVTKLKAELEASAQATVNGISGGVTAEATAAPPPDVTAQVGEAGCAPVHGPSGKPQALPRAKKIELKRVFVSHLEQPAEKGKVTINFFPLGRAEKAVVEVGQGAEDLFSVVMQPLTGKVQIQAGEYKHPEDFVEEDDTGEAQVE